MACGLRTARVPFLGGVVSAAVLYLVLEDTSLGFLAWFVLVPLFHQLWRDRDHPVARAAQGLTFGVGASWVLGRGPLVCAVLGLHAALFAWAAGGVLRSKRLGLGVLGLAVLWAGFELIRGSYSPFSASLDAACLSTAALLVPSSPECRVASLIGAAGLSLAIALTSSLFAATLRQERLPRRLGCAAAGCVIPLALRALGGGLGTPGQPSPPLCLIVAALDECRPASLEELIRPLVDPPPDAMIAAGRSPPTEPGGASDGWGGVATRARTKLLVGCASDDPAHEPLPARRSSEGIRVAAFGAGGTPEALPTGQHSPAGESVLSLPAGALGVGAGHDFDGPLFARRLAARASALVDFASPAPSLPPHAERHRERAHALRAVENGRSTVFLSGLVGIGYGPDGEESFRFDSFEAAGRMNLEARAGSTSYGRWGWMLEPVLIAAAAALAVGGFRRPRLFRS